MAQIDDYLILLNHGPAERVAIYMEDRSWAYSVGNKTPANIGLIAMAAKNLTFLGVETEVPKQGDVDTFFPDAKETIRSIVDVVSEYTTLKLASDFMM